MNRAEPGANRALSGNAADEEKAQKLWKYLLLFVIALFMCETFLANRSITFRMRER